MMIHDTLHRGRSSRPLIRRAASVALALALGLTACSDSGGDTAKTGSGSTDDSSGSTASSSPGSSSTSPTGSSTDPGTATNDPTVTSSPTTTEPAPTTDATTGLMTTGTATTAGDCGGDGQPCCDGDACAAFHACSEGVCVLQCEVNVCLEAGVAQGNVCTDGDTQALCKPDLFTGCPEGPFNMFKCPNGCDPDTGLCAGCEPNPCQLQGEDSLILCNQGTDLHCGQVDGCAVVQESHSCTNACFFGVGCCGSAPGEPCCNGDNCGFSPGLACVDGTCVAQ